MRSNVRASRLSTCAGPGAGPVFASEGSGGGGTAPYGEALATGIALGTAVAWGPRNGE
jgi:hypothetical protein